MEHTKFRSILNFNPGIFLNKVFSHFLSGNDWKLRTISYSLLHPTRRKLPYIIKYISNQATSKVVNCSLRSCWRKRESSSRSLCTYEGGPYAWVGPLATSNRQPSWRRTTKPIADGEESIRKEKKDAFFFFYSCLSGNPESFFCLKP